VTDSPANLDMVLASVYHMVDSLKLQIWYIFRASGCYLIVTIIGFNFENKRNVPHVIFFTNY
jgi:hypothetical protein